jgi:hypothetical protein
MKVVVIVPLVFLAACFSSGVAAQDGPSVPFADKGACPFECCTYRQWTVKKPTAVHSLMSDDSPIAFRLGSRDKVRGLTGTVITEKAGIAQALKSIEQDGVRLRAGDRIYLLTNLGEGFMKAWFKKRVFQAEPFDTSTFKIVRDPKSVWWVKVRNSKGKIGWSRQPENFGNMDQCGGG